MRNRYTALSSEGYPIRAYSSILLSATSGSPSKSRFGQPLLRRSLTSISQGHAMKCCDQTVAVQAKNRSLRCAQADGENES